MTKSYDHYPRGIDGPCACCGTETHGLIYDFRKRRWYHGCHDCPHGALVSAIADAQAKEATR